MGKKVRRGSRLAFPFAIRYWPFAAFYSLLAIRYSPPYFFTTFGATLAGSCGGFFTGLRFAFSPALLVSSINLEIALALLPGSLSKYRDEERISTRESPPSALPRTD